MKNQLFRKIPSREFVENYLKLFIPKGFDQYYQFYRHSISDKNILEKMKLPYFKNNFEKYYLPCKYKKYFPDLDDKKCITILRQLLKVYGYNIVSKEKYVRGKKSLIYNIMKNFTILKKKKIENLILFFD